ncbi:hypothetical protein AAG906_028250 [Vitis piasezkii]
MTFVLLFSHRDLGFNKLYGEIPNLDGLTNVEVYSLAPSYMGYGGGHKSGALGDCITWGKGVQYLWDYPLQPLNENIPWNQGRRVACIEIDLSYSNFSEQSALPSCRDSLQELFLSKLNLVKL